MKTRKILSGQASAVRGKANNKGWFTPGVNSIIRTAVLGIGGGIGLYVCKKKSDECDARLQDESLSKEELKEISESYGRYRLGMGVSGVVIGLGAINGILGIVDYCKSKKKKKKKFKKFRARRCLMKSAVDDPKVFGKIKVFDRFDENGDYIAVDLGDDRGVAVSKDPAALANSTIDIDAFNKLTPVQLEKLGKKAEKNALDFGARTAQFMDVIAPSVRSMYQKLARLKKRGVDLDGDHNGDRLRKEFTEMERFVMGEGLGEMLGTARKFYMGGLQEEVKAALKANGLDSDSDDDRLRRPNGRWRRSYLAFNHLVVKPREKPDDQKCSDERGEHGERKAF